MPHTKCARGVRPFPRGQHLQRRAAVFRRLVGFGLRLGVPYGRIGQSLTVFGMRHALFHGGIRVACKSKGQ